MSFKSQRQRGDKKLEPGILPTDVGDPSESRCRPGRNAISRNVPSAMMNGPIVTLGTMRTSLQSFSMFTIVLMFLVSSGWSQTLDFRSHDWPDSILLPEGFEPEGIELGRGHDFFAGGFSISSFLGPIVDLPHDVSLYAGAIYKGDLQTGKGMILVPPSATGRMIAGLSYDRRTDYIYAATGDPAAIGEFRMNLGVVIYNGTSGDKVDEIIFGDGIGVNDILVTESAVFATDSTRAVIYKIPLENGGRLPLPPVFETVELTGPGVGPRNNGLVGSFDGNDLVVINDTSGILYHVDTQSGAATPLEILGDEGLFVNGDGLYLSGRTLYIMQNFDNKIAVVNLSGDLSWGKFVKNLVSDDFRTPTTILGFGDSIYAVNSHVLFDGSAEDVIFNSGTVTCEVVKVHK